MGRLCHGIDGVRDLHHAAFIDCFEGRGGRDAFMQGVASELGARCSFISGGPDAVSAMLVERPDIIFVGPPDKAIDPIKFEFCRDLRAAGHRGIVVLITTDTRYDGGTSSITSAGFDNYLLGSESWDHIVDALNWAILNRKRKNKYIIQFDGNPDAFYTIGHDGRIFDINAVALAGSNFTPRRVVVDGINIRELGTLGCFEEDIKPFVTEDNVGLTLSFTCEENDRVFQVKAGIHDVTTLGLVATVIKTDITRTMYARTMDILANSITMLSERDNYTAGHSARVFYYVRHIAERMGIDRSVKVIRPLYFASLLHDIGKIGVRDDILLKPGRLEAAEFRELISHTTKGSAMLQHYELLRECLHLVRSHHERPDGRGYPDNLAGEGIPLGASIIAVADGFDAMTSTRPYRQAMPIEKAVAEIRAHMGMQFATEPAQAFLSLVTSELVGEVAELSDKPLITLSQELLDTFL